jgi:uncharacterized membrane protein
MPSDDYWRDVGERAQPFGTIREEVDRHSSGLGRVFDHIGRVLSNPVLFLGLVLAHAGWMVVNLRLMPWRPWDPYPFTFLATLASIEAPFIALLVLMHERRMARIEELRQEVSYRLDLHLERQSSLLLRVAGALAERDGALGGIDRELLERLQRDLDPERLVEAVRRSLREEEGEDGGAAP